MRIIFITKKSIITTISTILIIIITSFSFFTYAHYSNYIYPAKFSDVFVDKITNIYNGNEKVAYLTFDDGPSSSVTPEILDILKSEGVKATFFVIGKNVEANPDIVKRAYKEGHYIANHSYSHNNSVLYKNSESFLNEVQITDIAIGKAIGIENYCSHVFRFPNGFMSPSYKSKKLEAAQLLSKIDYAYLDWNCLNNDSIKKYSNAQLLNNLKESCKNKNTLVILMHDTKDVNDSSLVLKASIQYLKSQGYEFKNLYDLLK